MPRASQVFLPPSPTRLVTSDWVFSNSNNWHKHSTVLEPKCHVFAHAFDEHNHPLVNDMFTPEPAKLDKHTYIYIYIYV